MPKGIYLKFSEIEIAFFERTRHLNYGRVQFYLANIFGRNIEQSVLRKWLTRHGFNRTFDTNNGKFTKGHKTWNKGMKGYCPSPHTLFQKGHGCRWKAKELGAERTNRYGHVEVKVVKDRAEMAEQGLAKMWRYRSHLVWEAHSGEPVPKGMIVFHLNSNPADDRIENLTLITQRENLALVNHGFHQLPPEPEIRQAMLTLIKFDIKRREFDEKHGLYKKYTAKKKTQSPHTSSSRVETSYERGETGG